MFRYEDDGGRPFPYLDDSRLPQEWLAKARCRLELEFDAMPDLDLTLPRRRHMLSFEYLDPRVNRSHLGLIPMFLSSYDPQPAAKQIDLNYAHGGGWHSFKGFKLNQNTRALCYPGDPPMKPIAEAHLREETILFYPHAWVAIVQEDGSFDVARID